MIEPVRRVTVRLRALEDDAGGRLERLSIPDFLVVLLLAIAVGYIAGHVAAAAIAGRL